MMVERGTGAAAQVNARVHLAGGSTGLGLRGPGSLGQDGAAGAFIFRAGDVATAGELLSTFVAEDLARLDWLHDYLLNREILDVTDAMDEPFEHEEEDPETLYNKRDMPAGSGDVLYDA